MYATRRFAKSTIAIVSSICVGVLFLGLCLHFYTQISGEVIKHSYIVKFLIFYFVVGLYQFTKILYYEEKEFWCGIFSALNKALYIGIAYILASGAVLFFCFVLSSIFAIFAILTVYAILPEIAIISVLTVVSAFFSTSAFYFLGKRFSLNVGLEEIGYSEEKGQ